jgi:hypothetical protein
MPPAIKFEYKGKFHEVRTTVIGNKFLVRAFCEGDAVQGVGYSISAKGKPVVALMRQAQRDVLSGRAAEVARINRAVENQMEKLRPLARGYKVRSTKR